MTTAPGPALELNVQVRRGSFVLDAAISVDEGQTVALLGPNGAGKSTLLAILAGLLRPDQGRVVLNGVVLDDTELGIHVPPQQRRVGVVFQDLLLFPHLDALRNVAFPLAAAGLAAPEVRTRAARALADLDLAPLAGARPAALSGGEAQRVALARALIAAPDLLLLDEPLSSLDVQSRGRTRAVLRAVLARFDAVCLLITHDPVDAMTLADRLVILEGGRVTQAGTVDEIRRVPRSAFAADLTGQNVFLGRLEPLEDGAGRLRTRDGDVVVGWPGDLSHTPIEAVGTLRPSEVTVHLSAPDSSARNVLHGRIASIGLEHDRARVHVASRPPVQAELTPASVARLGLAEGREVWLSFKATAVDVAAG